MFANVGATTQGFDWGTGDDVPNNMYLSVTPQHHDDEGGMSTAVTDNEKSRPWETATAWIP